MNDLGKAIIDFLKENAEPDFNIGNWFSDLIQHIYLKIISEVAREGFEFIIKSIEELIFEFTSLELLQNNTFNYSSVLIFIQAIAATFLVFLVTLEAFERQSSGLLGSQKENTMLPVIGRAITGGVLIYFLPDTFMKILLKINWFIIQGITSLVKMNVSVEDVFLVKFGPVPGLIPEPMTHIFMLAALILLIALGVLAFNAAVRFVEIIVCILFAPIVAALYVRNGEYLTTWLKYTCAIVFTQVFHALFLLIAMKIVLSDGAGINALLSGSKELAITKFLTLIGTLVVAIKGPKVIKEFLYTSGAGTGLVGFAGTGARIAAYKAFFRLKGVK